MFPPEVRRYGGMTAEFKATSQHIPVELLKKISFRLEGHWAPDSKEENEKIFVAEKATEILPETESEVCKFLMVLILSSTSRLPLLSLTSHINALPKL